MALKTKSRQRVVHTKNKLRSSPKSPVKFSLVIKLGFTAIVIYFTYLIVLPLITALVVPCLGNHPFISFKDADCSVDLALNRYLLLAISGLGLLTICVWIILKSLSTNFNSAFLIPNSSFKMPIHMMRILVILLTCSLMAVMLIVCFMFFIPTAETAVRHAPIILETMKKTVR